MLRKLCLTSVFFCAPLLAATPLWHCSATNKSGAVWNWYGPTETAARAPIQKACSQTNNNQGCGMLCFPPKVYYRCFSHDTLPINQSVTPGQPVSKQGTWYWSSFSKKIAMNGARDACRHNSPYGGCYVTDSQCASS